MGSITERSAWGGREGTTAGHRSSNYWLIMSMLIHFSRDAFFFCKFYKSSIERLPYLL